MELQGTWDWGSIGTGDSWDLAPLVWDPLGPVLRDLRILGLDTLGTWDSWNLRTLRTWDSWDSLDLGLLGLLGIEPLGN
jgi:hypothetical protein